MQAQLFHKRLHLLLMDLTFNLIRDMKNLGFIVGGVAAVALIGFLFFRKKQEPINTDVSQETTEEKKDVSKAGKSIPIGSVMTKDRKLIAPPMKSGAKKTLNLSNTIQLKNDRQDDTIFEKAVAEQEGATFAFNGLIF